MKRMLITIFSLLLIMQSACNYVSTDTTVKDAIVFTDSLGYKVTLSNKPQRVAALLGSFADVWYTSGGTLCAAADDAWNDFDLPLDNVVNIGGAHSPSLEMLLSAKPDFVIASSITASNVQMRDTLVAAGITVAYFNVTCFDDYLNMLKICTDITGRKDLYEKNGLSLKEKITSIKENYQNDNIPSSFRKVLLIRISPGLIRAKGSKGTILGEMLSDMGCINIADNDHSLLENLSLEAILKEAPHHIFVVTMGSDTEGAKQTFESMLKENPAWNTLDAINEGRLHYMDKKLFNNKPNRHWAQAYEILYETLKK